MLVYQRVIVDISSVLDYILQRRELAQFVLNDDATQICSSTFALQILDTNNKKKGGENGISPCTGSGNYTKQTIQFVSPNIPIISSTIDYKYKYIYINILTDVWLYPCVFYGISHELSPCFLQNSQVAESQGWKTMS